MAPCFPTSGCPLKAYTIATKGRRPISCLARSRPLETTPGKAINFKVIIRRLAEIQTQFGLQRVAYDRAYVKIFNMQCEERRAPAAEGIWPGLHFNVTRRAMMEAAVLDGAFITAAIRFSDGR